MFTPKGVTIFFLHNILEEVVYELNNYTLLVPSACYADDPFILIPFSDALRKMMTVVMLAYSSFINICLVVVTVNLINLTTHAAIAR